MKSKVTDQADKLRQLAKQEKPLKTPPNRLALAMVETDQPSTSVESASPPTPPVSPPDPVENNKSTAVPEPDFTPQAAPECAEATKEEVTVQGEELILIQDEGESPSDLVEVEVPVEETDRPALQKFSTLPAKKSAGKESGPPLPIPVEKEKNPAAATQIPAPILFSKPAELEAGAFNNFFTTRFPMDTHTQVIAITGGKGGVGKSNVAANLAICFAKMRKNVMLMDADLSLANIDVLFGLTPRLNIAHVISGEKTLSDILVQGPCGVTILPGGSGIEELANLSSERLTRLFQAFATFSPPPDLLLLDTAAGIHPNVLQFLMAADRVIVVTTPEPTAYVDAYALIKTLVKRDPEKEIGVIINMAKDAREAMEVIRLLLELCRKVLHVGFNNLGYIPHDPEVFHAVRHQQPLVIKSPSSPAAKAIQNISATLLQMDGGNNYPRGLFHFFRRLFRNRRKPKTISSLK